MNRKRALFYTLVFILGFAAVSLLSFWMVIHPRQYHAPYTPDAFSLPAEDVMLETGDGLPIAGWHIPSTRAPERAILILHGYPADKADMLPLAADLYPEFSLLLIDLRHFGESGGSATTLGVREPADIGMAIDFLAERYGRIGIFGYSFGGSVALLSAANDPRIDAVASYAAFSSLRDMGYDAYTSLSLLRYPLVEFINVWMRLSFGAWGSSVSPVSRIGDIPAPVFIGHTTGDDIIPLAHATRLIEARKRAGGELTTFLADGTSHIGLPIDIGARLAAFFADSL